MRDVPAPAVILLTPGDLHFSLNYVVGLYVCVFSCVSRRASKKQWQGRKEGRKEGLPWCLPYCISAGFQAEHSLQAVALSDGSPEQAFHPAACQSPLSLPTNYKERLKERGKSFYAVMHASFEACIFLSSAFCSPHQRNAGHLQIILSPQTGAQTASRCSSERSVKHVTLTSFFFF